MANEKKNGLHVKQDDIWTEIRRHRDDVNFFKVDTFTVASAPSDGRVFVGSEAACSSDRIRIVLNTWALARSSTLDASDLRSLLREQQQHYFHGILHPGAEAPVTPSFPSFIHDRAAKDRHFEYERPIPLCHDTNPEDAREGNITSVEAQLIVRGRYYVTDDDGDSSFSIQTSLFTNGDQRDAKLTVDDGSGALGSDVTSPIPGTAPSSAIPGSRRALLAKKNNVGVGDGKGGRLSVPTGNVLSKKWTDLRLETAVEAPPFGDQWLLGFSIDVKTEAKPDSPIGDNSTLVLIGPIEIILQPLH